MITDLLIDPIRIAILASAHALGGNVGAGILVVSFAMRVALLPLTVRLARRSVRQRQMLESIQPELNAIRERHAREPELMYRETMVVYRRAGVRPVDPVGLLGGLAQLPVVSGTYGALRSISPLGGWGWIADLGRSDFAAAVVVALLSGLAGLLASLGMAPNPRGAWSVAAIGAVISFLIVSHMSAAIVLSWGASSTVGVLQAAWLRRRVPS